jgi:formate C-acetyltransferase
MYGNDNDEADQMLKRVFTDFVSYVEKTPDRNGVLRPAGVSTFGREIGWCGDRGTSPQGIKKGTFLATNFSPTPGTDKKGPTAVIKSHCSMGLVRIPCGTALELKLLPESIKGDSGIDAVVGLLRTFVQLGGFFMQIDVVSNEMLVDAQQHPDKYPNLCVRISGWSARFNTLNNYWQDMIIQRTQQK